MRQAPNLVLPAALTEHRYELTVEWTGDRGQGKASYGAP